MTKNFNRILDNLFPSIRKAENKKLLEEFSNLRLPEKTEKLYSSFKRYTKINKKEYWLLQSDFEIFIEKTYFPEEKKCSLLNEIFREVLENAKIDDIKYLIKDCHYNEMERQLEKFKSLDLSKKLEKIFPEKNHGHKLFIEHPDISEELKHKGLHETMQEYLNPQGELTEHQLFFHWMMCRLGLEDIYEKEFAKYYFSPDDFYQTSAAYGADPYAYGSGEY